PPSATLFPYTTLFRSQAGGDGTQRWDEARWEGTPGEQSVWVVPSQPRRPRDLYRVAIRGRGPFRYFLPYGATNGSYKLPVVKVRSEEHTSELQSRFDL